MNKALPILFLSAGIFAVSSFFAKEFLLKNKINLSRANQRIERASHFSDKLCDTIKGIADREHAFDCDKLLISLNKNFYNDSEFQTLLDTIDRGNSLNLYDIRIASRYLDFFEPFYHLIKRGYFNIEEVDDMFAYRFFAVVNNPDVQKKLISEHYSYYGNICRLYDKWISYRKGKTHWQLPLPQTELSDYDWYQEMCHSEQQIF